MKFAVVIEECILPVVRFLSFVVGSECGSVVHTEIHYTSLSYASFILRYPSGRCVNEHYCRKR